MGKKMKKNEEDLEKSAKAALIACLSKIPFLKIVGVQDAYCETNSRPDLTVKIELPDRVVQLIAEVKASGQPRIAREAVNQMLRYKGKGSDVYFIFIAQNQVHTILIIKVQISYLVDVQRITTGTLNFRHLIQCKYNSKNKKLNSYFIN